MSRPEDVNPYAPTQVSLLGADAALVSPARPMGVSAAVLCLCTTAVCLVSGALFGVAAVAVFFLVSLVSGEPMGQDGLGGLAMFGVIAAFSGGALATIAAVPVILINIILSIAIRPYGKPWTRRSVGRFALWSGLFCGFLPFTVIGEFAWDAMAFSIVPALFGAATGRLLITPLARRAGEDPPVKNLEIPEAADSPPTDHGTPLPIPPSGN